MSDLSTKFEINLGDFQNTINTVMDNVIQSVGKYLSELGFNVDFAPCADVLTNPNNTVIGNRAYSDDPHVVSEFANAFAKGLSIKKIVPALKHFPGHGNTDGDSHEGYVFSNKTINELYDCELIPFCEGIDDDIPMVMIGHIALPSVTGSNEPASLSKMIITGLLRDELKFDGVIVTDSLKMKAISEAYSSTDAAVKVLEAGADMILRPESFYEAYAGIVKAVKIGVLTEKRIDESLRRILKLKLSEGL